jgi:cytidylate kinase
MIISIGGQSASGKSTLAKALSSELKWVHISAGAIFRKMADEQNIDFYEFSRQAFDNADIDKRVAQELSQVISSNDNCVLDAHAAYFVTHNLNHIAVFLYCSQEERARRLAQRYGFVFEEALRKIEILDREITTRMYKLYKRNIEDISWYNLVINTAKTDILTSIVITKSIVEQTLRAPK